MLARSHCPSSRRSAARWQILAASVSALAAIGVFAFPAAASTAISGAYAPNEILVRYAPGVPARARAATARYAGGIDPVVVAAHTRLLRLAPGVSVASALERLRGRRDVAWAVPDYLAHASGGWIPNDQGTGRAPGDWQQLQWNFAGPFGVNAPEAWANVAADARPAAEA